MRVLYVLGHGTLGGIERHVQAILNNLPAEVEPALCVLMEPGVISDQIVQMGVPAHFAGAKRGFDPRAFVGLRKAVRKYRPCVVHSHEMHSMSALAIVSLRGVVRVHTEHCSYANSPSQIKSRIVWRTLSSQFDRILGVSQNTRQSIVQAGLVSRERTEVLPNAIDLQSLPARNTTCLHKELGISKDHHLIGMAGRLAEQKDWRSFLQVCALIARREDSARFVAIGDGPQKAQLHDLACELAIGDRVHWLGWRDDALRLLGGLDVFLLTSYHEELPTTLLEALAMETPVVGFLPGGGTEDVLQHTPDSPPAILLPQRDCEQLASLACKILNDPIRADQLRAQGKAVVHRHYDMKSVAKKLVGTYSDLLEKRGLNA